MPFYLTSYVGSVKPVHRSSKVRIRWLTKIQKPAVLRFLIPKIDPCITQTRTRAIRDDPETGSDPWNWRQNGLKPEKVSSYAPPIFFCVHTNLKIRLFNANFKNLVVSRSAQNNSLYAFARDASLQQCISLRQAQNNNILHNSLFFLKITSPDILILV